MGHVAGSDRMFGVPAVFPADCCSVFLKACLLCVSLMTFHEYYMCCGRQKGSLLRGGERKYDNTAEQWKKKKNQGIKLKRLKLEREAQELSG